jgi:F-type H+-transporting ATPase subunit delta
MSKAHGKVSKRYARALFELYDSSSVEGVRDSLSAMATIWSTNTELREGLRNPAHPLKERVQALGDIAQRMRAGDKTFANFLTVLLDNGRIGALPGIATSFSAMVDELKRRLSLEITSAFPIEENEKQETVTRIQREFGSLASVSWNVNPEIIGGLIVKAGDRLLDTSVSGALENLQESLLN